MYLRPCIVVKYEAPLIRARKAKHEKRSTSARSPPGTSTFERRLQKTTVLNTTSGQTIALGGAGMTRDSPSQLLIAHPCRVRIEVPVDVVRASCVAAGHPNGCQTIAADDAKRTSSYRRRGGGFQVRSNGSNEQRERGGTVPPQLQRWLKVFKSNKTEDDVGSSPGARTHLRSRRQGSRGHACIGARRGKGEHGNSKHLGGSRPEKKVVEMRTLLEYIQKP